MQLQMLILSDTATRSKREHGHMVSSFFTFQFAQSFAISAACTRRMSRSIAVGIITELCKVLWSDLLQTRRASFNTNLAWLQNSVNGAVTQQSKL